MSDSQNLVNDLQKEVLERVNSSTSGYRYRICDAALLEVERKKVKVLCDRVAELEAAQQWHPASVPPEPNPDCFNHLEHSEPVVVCHGEDLKYSVDNYNYEVKCFCRFGMVHCWKYIGEPPDYAVDAVMRDLPPMPVKS